MDCIPGFRWPVPQAFLEPITFCRFERGDMLYDNPVVYALTWGEGKNHLGFSVQVKAPDKKPGQADQDESVFETNWTSPVVLEITNYRDGSVETLESTQGSLYTALRFADLSHLRRPPPEPPLRWKKLVSWLSEKQKAGTLTLHPLGQAVADLECPHAFVLAGDCGSPITQRKLANIHESLRGEAFDYRTVELKVADLNDPELQRFAPTTRLYLFGVKTSARAKLADALKRVLYKPDSSGKTGADRFQLGRHGVIIDERSPKDKEVVCHSFVHGTFYRLRYSPRRCQAVDARFSNFIESIFDNCPNDEFENPPRCSDLCSRFSLQGKVNFSRQGHWSQLWRSCPKERTFKSFHEHLQVYFLNADTKTVAVEIPVWVGYGESAALDRVIGLETDDLYATLTGHIDLVRFEDGLVWILDYKPNAAEARCAAQQVYLYAYMLACRTGMPIQQFRCGYFDDHSEFAFDPSEMSLVAPRPGSLRSHLLENVLDLRINSL